MEKVAVKLRHDQASTFEQMLLIAVRDKKTFKSLADKTVLACLLEVLEKLIRENVIAYDKKTFKLTMAQAMAIQHAFDQGIIFTTKEDQWGYITMQSINTTLDKRTLQLK